MKTILFIDIFCPQPYSFDTLENEGMGGTEATLLRVSKALSKYLNIRIFQHNRKEDLQVGNVTFTGTITKDPVQYICYLRTISALSHTKAVYPDARLLAWLHDIADANEFLDLESYKDSYEIITVSDFHKINVIETARSVNFDLRRLKVKTIYNLIDNDLVPTGKPYDNNKLVFFSSPHKGLKRALELFKIARNFNPEFKLYIANPGYIPDYETDLEGVVNLGKLSNKAVLEHVSDSMCVFYPNTVFPETFGLVFAEANALGVPVLTHSLGASHEVLDHPAQMVDCTDNKKVIDRLMAWHSGMRPIVRGNPEFRLNKVITEWRRLLNV